ncbi:hypothetical protein [Alteromonas ponticola]|uniref:Uncharacterized protein n=1 Tax=Alteromonas ponticola TaxID=2720613 RepID=A0ABX1R3J3_9ALTE|nr:hypothetical protein [Alteromonas ponticola]NMH61010.1 hypothetical protein [Alteromonas ponticola]
MKLYILATLLISLSSVSGSLSASDSPNIIEIEYNGVKSNVVSVPINQSGLIGQEGLKRTCGQRQAEFNQLREIILAAKQLSEVEGKRQYFAIAHGSEDVFFSRYRSMGVRISKFNRGAELPESGFVLCIHSDNKQQLQGNKADLYDTLMNLGFGGINIGDQNPWFNPASISTEDYPPGSITFFQVVGDVKFYAKFYNHVIQSVNETITTLQNHVPLNEREEFNALLPEIAKSKEHFTMGVSPSIDDSPIELEDGWTLRNAHTEQNGIITSYTIQKFYENVTAAQLKDLYADRIGHPAIGSSGDKYVVFENDLSPKQMLHYLSKSKPEEKYKILVRFRTNQSPEGTMLMVSASSQTLLSQSEERSKRKLEVFLDDYKKKVMAQKRSDISL